MSRHYSQHYYVVLNKSFKSLEDAKFYLVVGLTRTEAKKYLRNGWIHHYIGNILHDSVPIYVSEDGYISFGQTHLAIPF